jgi:hypothetical protein
MFVISIIFEEHTANATVSGGYVLKTSAHDETAMREIETLREV